MSVGIATQPSFIAMMEDREVVVNKFSAALIGAVIFATVMSSAVAPAFALGGCGANRHRNYFGRCVFGGQNENYCLRRTGHYATRMRNGNLRCF